MRKRVLILDTSVLCCWLQVPGKETAGPANHRTVRALDRRQFANVGVKLA